MKAMENDHNNNGDHNNATVNGNNLSSLIFSGSSVNSHTVGASVAPPNANNTGNSSSISVVVVPLIQNAFDLGDDRRPSLAQIAAKQPIIFTKQNGSHTTMHVVRKKSKKSTPYVYNQPPVYTVHVSKCGRSCDLISIQMFHSPTNLPWIRAERSALANYFLSFNLHLQILK